MSEEKQVKSFLTTRASDALSEEIEDELNKKDPEMDKARASINNAIFGQNTSCDKNKQQGNGRSCRCKVR